MRSDFIILFAILIMQIYADEQPRKFLIFGGNGWIGQKLKNVIIDSGNIAIISKTRIENRNDVEQEIKSVNPDFIINSAGKTGVPNVDWCEDHKQETIRSNIIGALNLADISYQRGIHMTNIGTGCIYEYDGSHAVYSGRGFTEDDEPNFFGSFYSKTKVYLEKLITNYPNVLNLRLRMPISSDLHERNFITKITKYKKVINVPNSMSILDNLLPLVPKMAIMGKTGIYNFVNPGTISHNEILDLYKLYIDSNFNYENFSIEEQNSILKSRRSNNELDASKLSNLFPELQDIHVSIISVFQKMRNSR